MSTLLSSFWGVCLFRRGPQDLPASAALWRTMLLFALLSGVITLSLSLESVLAALLFQVGDLALLSYLVLHILEALKRGARFRQTTTAIYGTSTLLNFLTIPVLMIIHLTPQGSEIGSLALILFLGLVIWSVAVLGHIFRHAFEVHAVAGVLIAFLYFVLVNLMAEQFLPSP